MAALATADLPVTISDIERMLKAKVGVIEGTDSKENDYDSIEDLWKRELTTASTRKKRAAPHSSSASVSEAPSSSGGLKWYTKAFEYWENEANCPLSDDGVLGGYGRVTPLDARDSHRFLDTLSQQRPELQFDKAADCGAGIGRVSKYLLLRRFKHVDLIEQSPRLLAAAPEYVTLSDGSDRMTCIVQGLQDFAPPPNSYDVIWIQWVIGHLHDLDFIRFFKRCATGLRPGGVIILKDNCAQNYTFVVDSDDSSVARCVEYATLLLNLSGLDIILQVQQTDFPKELYPVIMFALVPKV